MSVFNGLRGIFDEKIFARPFLASSGADRLGDEERRAKRLRKGGIAHENELSFVSAFPQAIVDRKCCQKMLSYSDSCWFVSVRGEFRASWPPPDLSPGVTRSSTPPWLRHRSG